MPDDDDGPENDAPIPSQEEQTAAAKDLTQRKKATRAEVDHDDPTGPRAPDSASTGLAGIDAFHAITRIAPFLALARLYSEAFYARRKSPRARFDAFASDHKWLVRIAYTLDTLLRLALVVLILAVIMKGVAPLENPFSGAPLPATPAETGHDSNG